ncbi:MAG: tubulin-like doman-containing protein [Gemmatales bacterium]|nr:tubulin-like doman-containing protein [Gemmatales bacterium]
MPVRIEVGAEPIPGYRLLNRIGGGGFGEVWRAEAPGGLLKAIKFVYGDLHLSDIDAANRAQQELKALARVKKVRHPFVLSLERFDVVEGQLIIVMELADRSLWDRFRECRSKGLSGIPRAELLGYMEEAAEALDLMNIQYDLQHLDIKPQNLFLIHQHVKVADFGLVKDLQGLAASVTGGITPVYAAPETFEGWVSRYSDQYSLAIVYMELLTGVRPYKASTPQQMIQMHLSGKPDLSALPASDQPIIARALAKTPHERHPSCLEMVHALKRSGGEARRVIFPTCAEAPEDMGDADLAPSPPIAHEVPAEAVPPANGAGTLTQAVERRSEHLGTGIFVPALVLGLGGWGLAVLRRFTSYVAERYGSLLELPHLRLIHLDTDPEAQHGWGQEFLQQGGEIILARLQRPARYLRPKDHLPDISEWLDPQMLYRMPRSQLTGGMRALGRLAFVEHYRTIRQRLEQALTSITQPQALEQACRRWQTEICSDWPVVIIVTHLAGGTGSGMFLDAAYVVRQLLMQMGYLPPRVLALLNVGPPDAHEGNLLAVANTYAALCELQHYQAGGQQFTARYETKGPLLRDVAAPFLHCILTSAAPDQDTAQQSANWLYRELLSPLGRQANLMRNVEAATAKNSKVGAANASWCAGYDSGSHPPPRVSVFGLASLEHPHRQILRGVATHLAARLVRRWCDTTPDDWAELPQTGWRDLTEGLALEPEVVELTLEQLACQALGSDFLTAVRQALEQLCQQYSEPPLLACAALKLWEDWLGNPDELAGSWRKFVILQPWRDHLEKLRREAEEVLLAWVWHFLEVPSARRAGAEAAVHWAVTQLQTWTQTLEERREQVLARQQAAEAELDDALKEWERLSRAWVRDRRNEQRKLVLQDRFLAALTQLAIARYQRVAVEALLRTYLSLRGRLSDQNKELAFCHCRLQELAHEFTQSCAQLASFSADAGYLYLRGNNLPEAVEYALADLPTDLLTKLDQRIQERLHQEATSLQRLCTSTGNSLIQLRQLLLSEIESYLHELWPQYDIAQLLLVQEDAEKRLPALVRQLYESAEPGNKSFGVTAGRSFCLVALPGSAPGYELAQQVRTSLPDDAVYLMGDPQEICIYREYVGIRLEDLPPMSSEARHAYEQICSLEHFTPHSRTDIHVAQKAMAVS